MGYNYNREKFEILTRFRIGGEEAVFATELTKIKECEAKADQLQKKARADSKQILETAKAKADQIAEEAENRAKDRYDSLLAEGEKISQEQYDLFLNSMRSQCEAMVDKAKNNETSAIDLIAERIVSKCQL